MKGVSVDDIPASLSDHLDAEHMRLQQDHYIKSRPIISEQKYCLQEDLENFTNYGVSHDLYELPPRGKERKVFICHDSNKLAVLFQIAAEIATPICDFLLLRMKRYTDVHHKHAPLRPYQWYIDVGHQLPYEHIDSGNTFKDIEKRDNVGGGPLLVVHRNQTTFAGISEGREEAFAYNARDCRAEWDRLRHAEMILLNELHALFKKCVPGMASPDYNPGIGCNIFNVDIFFTLVQKYKFSLSPESQKNLDDIEPRFLPLKTSFMEHFYRHGNFIKQIAGEMDLMKRVLVAPLKVFDEQRILPPFLPLPSGVKFANVVNKDTIENGHGRECAVKFVTFMVAVIETQQQPGGKILSIRPRQLNDYVEGALTKRCPSWDVEKIEFDIVFSLSPNFNRQFPEGREDDNISVKKFLQEEVLKRAGRAEHWEDSEWRFNLHPSHNFFDFSITIVLSVTEMSVPRHFGYETWIGKLADTIDVTLVPTCITDAEIVDSMASDFNERSTMDLEIGMSCIRRLHFQGSDVLMSVVIRIGEELRIPPEQLLLVLAPSPVKKGAPRRNHHPLQIWPIKKSNYRQEEADLRKFTDYMGLITSHNRFPATIYYRIVPFPLCRISHQEFDESRIEVDHRQNHSTRSNDAYLFHDPDKSNKLVDIRDDNEYVEMCLVDAALRRLRRDKLLMNKRDAASLEQEKRAGEAGNNNLKMDDDASKGLTLDAAQISEARAPRGQTGIDDFFDTYADKVYCAIDRKSSLSAQLSRRLGISKSLPLCKRLGLELGDVDYADNSCDENDYDLAVIFFLSRTGLADVLITDSDSECELKSYLNDDFWVNGYYRPKEEDIFKLTSNCPPLSHSAWYPHPFDRATFQLSGPPNEQWHFCMQLITADDLRHMRGGSFFAEDGDSEVHCTIVTVCFFTLHGPAAQKVDFDVETTENECGMMDANPRDKRRYNRPFFSYIRSDDTNQTLEKRLRRILYGDEEDSAVDFEDRGDAGHPMASTESQTIAPFVVSKLRLAVIDDNRRANFLEATQRHGTTVWDKLQAAYPKFCEAPLQEALKATRDGLPPKGKSNFDQAVCLYYPRLGIQLSEGKLKEFRRPTVIPSVLSKRKSVSDANISMKQ